jgi:serine protease Do
VIGRDSIKALMAIPADQDRETTSILSPHGKVVEAELVGVDLETDLAVLKLRGENFPYLDLGDSDTVGQGEIVLAMGSPLGLDNSVSIGIVSSVARQLKQDDPVVYIQTDATINPGNSGGPLISAEGKVVGINTFILSQSGGNEGLGFAIPSNIVNHVYRQIREHGRVRRGEIGINAQTITPELASALKLRKPWGAIVSDVRPGSSADTAGMKIGDIILSLDGKTIENGRQFDVNLYRREIGSQVSIKVLRSLQTPTVRVRITERFSAKDQFVNLVDLQNNLVPKLGILGVDIEPNIAVQIAGSRGENGVLVAALSPEAIRWSGNLQPGDVIYSVNGQLTANLESLRSLVEPIEEGEPLALQVLREGVLRFVAFELD